MKKRKTRFSEYLAEIGENPNSYARKNGLVQSTVQRIASGETVPRLPLVLFIKRESGGKVTENDWLGKSIMGKEVKPDENQRHTDRPGQPG